MSNLIKAIEEANLPLKKAGLPSYDKVVALLQEANTKLGHALAYQQVASAESTAELRAKIAAVIDAYPYP
ncbi:MULTISPECIES: hypothetical protein [Herbaspirillum]|uniref:hypothetical protein n=1 Tax=Herbaspirillum TaxID=963 RepID=UPI000C0AD817|nr:MULTISPECIES: hypothetical protein [Herbaspirillum]MAF04731.1 hypothetical protein [Herbaspirillum sp.]UWE19327.1 hypothetical protein NY669_26995 [Herbaspirillum huttiense]|tara:strand:- start:440 stop:649 length:210 start_codon:yes stop_codon:yes gene_type:complete